MRPVWILDADGIEFDNREINNIYRTNTVDEFLDNEKKLGIAAPRGLGKTFLIKAKRMIMQNKHGVICLPINSMVDTISSPKFSDSNSRFFEDYINWKLLWKVSIQAAIIKQYWGYNLNDMLQNIYSEKLNCEIKKLLSLNFTRISEYVNYLICNERKATNIIFTNCNCLDVIFNSINTPICAFIDKVDQAFSNQAHEIIGQSKMSTGPRNASFWQFAQLSLADVSYELLAKNAHIKIYYSIRSEALVDAAQISETFQNVKQYYCELSYSREELQEMYCQYIRFEKDENLYDSSYKVENPSIAFLGIDKIDCKYIDNTNEPVFEYILRHTFLRPRDIMDICYHLYAANLKLVDKDNLEDKIREIVNRESQVNLETYISSTEKMLFGINREHIEYLCQLINVNVMNLKYLKYICQRLNENFKDINSFVCDKDCQNCEELHPFCQLYNIGLIGYLWESRTDEASIRFYNQSDSIIGSANHVLPVAKYYYLHPCLASKSEHTRIFRQRDSGRFNFARNVLVKHGTIINKNNYVQIDDMIKSALREIKNDRVFISSTCYDLSDERKRIDKALSDLGYDVVRSDSETFNPNLNGIHSHDHCIEEMMKCNRVIYIIGERYGSPYSGEKYKSVVQEIVSESQGKIENPSISFMEYYLARKYNKKIFVFVDKKVYDEKQIYSRNEKNFEKYNPVFTDKIDVFHIINFITHQKTDNWFRIYSDFLNLEELIKITFDNFI